MHSYLGPPGAFAPMLAYPPLWIESLVSNCGRPLIRIWSLERDFHLVALISSCHILPSEVFPWWPCLFSGEHSWFWPNSSPQVHWKKNYRDSWGGKRHEWSLTMIAKHSWKLDLHHFGCCKLSCKYENTLPYMPWLNQMFYQEWFWQRDERIHDQQPQRCLSHGSQKSLPITFPKDIEIWTFLMIVLGNQAGRNLFSMLNKLCLYTLKEING